MENVDDHMDDKFRGRDNGGIIGQTTDFDDNLAPAIRLESLDVYLLIISTANQLT